MRVHNVRLGLATNSSSSHSIIFLKEGVRAVDYPSPAESGEFGWGHFTCASPETKLRYLGVMLRDRFYRELPHNIADVVVRNWLDGATVHEDDYVDHQSWYFIPNAFGTKLPDEQFFKDLKTYFLNDKIAILGGNDNTTLTHPLDDGTAFSLPLPQDCGRDTPYVCRYDDEYHYWTIFDPRDGRKIRFRLTEDPADLTKEIEKASAPELVDIKITDFCPFGCKFCYQGSTMQGQHADSYALSKFANSLAELKVFEVAIGGGEPTLHPDFIEILEDFRKVGVVPNFTTKNLQWLRDPKKWKPIMEHCGAFAYSVEDSMDMIELETLLRYNDIPLDRCVLHIVMGTIDRYRFKRLLDAAGERGFSVTLLGYKRVGFGENFRPQSYEWWLEEIKARHDQHRYGPTVSIDTVLAAESRQTLDAAEVPRWMYTTQDGKFSCYYDAVADKIGPSSYCPPHQMISMEDLRGNSNEWLDTRFIKEAFRYF